jgi:hypothetical protein
LPAPTGAAPYRLNLASILTDAAMAKITNNGRLVFHTVGDTGGVNTTTYQQQVETFMELDFHAGQSHVRGRSGSMFAFDVKESSRPRSGRAQLVVSRRAYVERYKAG